MHRQCVNAVTVLLDDLASKPILDKQNHSKLRPSIKFSGSEFRVVDLLQTGKVDIAGRRTMHLARLEDHPRGGSIWNFACLAQQRPENIADVVVAKVVDAKVTVDSISILAILVGVDAGGKYEEVETVERLTEASEDVLDLLERSQVAFLPVDICTGRFLLDGLDGLLTLLLLTIDHDHLGTAVGQGAGHLEANAQGTTSDNGDSALEVCGLDRSWTESSCLLKNGLHAER